jgi:hypothetical protein
MILRLICPTGHVLDVDSQLAGRKVRCGACGRIMLVPMPSGTKHAAAAKPPRKPLPRTQPKLPPDKPSIERPTAETPLVTTLLSEPPAAAPPPTAAESPSSAAPVYSESPAAEVVSEPPLELDLAQQGQPLSGIESAEFPLVDVLDDSLPPPLFESPSMVELLATEPAAEPPTIAFVRKPFASERPAMPSPEPPSEVLAARPTVAWPPAETTSITPAPAEDPEVQQTQSLPLSRYDQDRLEPRPLSSTAELMTDEAVTLPRSRGVEFLVWLRNRFPSHAAYLPDDAIEPSWAERRTARGLAAALAAIAVLNLLPVILSGHYNLLAAPPWAVLAVLLAVVQVVYAARLANAPDWSTVQVQMIVSASVTTAYAMLTTLALLTPSEKPLLFGLGEVRRLVPAWCGLMMLVMGGVTWYCGRTSAHWRRELAEEQP